MKLSIAAVLAFASAALAQTDGFDAITKPALNEKVPAGSTYKIVWSPSPANPGPVDISLLGGSSPGTLNILGPIATGVDGKAGSYDWHVDKTLGSLATYGIKIALASDSNTFQYGFPFKITGGSISSSSSSSSSSDSSSASSTSTKSHESATSSGNATQSSTTLSPSTTLSSTIAVNLTTTVSSEIASQTTITSLLTKQQTPTSTGASASSVPTNGVASLAASSFALIGGVAVAVLAL